MVGNYAGDAWSLCFFAVAELFGSHACCPFEEMDKGSRFGESQPETDFLNGYVGSREHDSFRLCSHVFVNPVAGRKASNLADDIGEILRREV